MKEKEKEKRKRYLPPSLKNNLLRLFKAIEETYKFYKLNGHESNLSI